MDINKVVLHSDFHIDGVSDAEASRPKTSTRRRSTRGLLLRNGVWHIDKVLFGKRICESTHTGDLCEAEVLLAHRVSQARRVHLYGEPAEHTFREAGVKFLKENQHKKTIERDVRTLKVLDPFIGSLPLKQVHQGTLEPYIQWRRKKGQVAGTINREIAVVKRILNLASRYWRDESHQPWISVAPMLPRLRQVHQREPYPLSVAEQQLLFSELSGHLKTMALFKVNTGLRQAEVVNLRWEWEVEIPELGASIFVIPREHTKLQLDRYVVLNRVARSIIASCRGKHREFVFTYQRNPVTKLYNSGWKAARRRAAERYPGEMGRPCPQGFRSIRVHDLKHAFGHRLRGAGVSFEDRKVLLGHKTHDVTTHYSAAEIGLLIAATERVCDLAERASPAIAVVRRRQPSSSVGPFTRPCVRPTPANQRRDFDSPPGLRPLPHPVSNCSAGHIGNADRPAEGTSGGGSNELPDRHKQVLPCSLKETAAELAETVGVSLDQFIAAAVAERIHSIRATETTRRLAPVSVNPHIDDEALLLGAHLSADAQYQPGAGGFEAGESSPGWDDARYWRWPTVTPPKVRRAEIIKKMSAKFPWIE
jgi:integrase